MEQSKIKYLKHAETGLPVVSHTGFVPIELLIALPELGHLVGDKYGVRPEDAVVMLKNGVAKLNVPKHEKPDDKKTAA